MAVPKIKSEKEVTKFLKTNVLDAHRTTKETNLSWEWVNVLLIAALDLLHYWHWQDSSMVRLLSLLIKALARCTVIVLKRLTHSSSIHTKYRSPFNQ